MDMVSERPHTPRRLPVGYAKPIKVSQAVQKQHSPRATLSPTTLCRCAYGPSKTLEAARALVHAERALTLATRAPPALSALLTLAALTPRRPAVTAPQLATQKPRARQPASRYEKAARHCAWPCTLVRMCCAA